MRTAAGVGSHIIKILHHSQPVVRLFEIVPIWKTNVKKSQIIKNHKIFSCEILSKRLSIMLFLSHLMQQQLYVINKARKLTHLFFQDYSIYY